MLEWIGIASLTLFLIIIWMQFSANLFRIVVWLALRLVNVLFIPVLICRLFPQKAVKIPPVKNDILLIKAGDLAEKIRKREVKSENVVRAYIGRIEEVNSILNAVVDERFAQAIEEAKNVDLLIASNKFSEDELKSKHPLLGVPITVKGSLAVRGLKFNCCSNVRDIKAEKHACIVSKTVEAGAIPLLVSTTPELCMNWETINKVTGVTKNPYDTRRTVGGSSGGECALLASASSIIGLGSDIAGSLRLPAHFCGVCGHKPSPGVVDLEGHFPDCLDRESWKNFFTLGPLARYMDDLELIFKCIIKPEMKEVLELDREVKIEDIKVYYIEDYDSFLHPKVNTNVRKSIQMVTEFLKTRCKDRVVQKINVQNLGHAGELSFIHLLSIEGIENVFPNQSDGVFSELFKLLTWRSKYTITPVFYGLYRKLLAPLIKDYEIKATKSINRIKENIIKVLGNDSILITPTFTNEAHLHYDIYRKIFSPAYLSVFNSLGLPVTNCPVMMTSDGLPVGIQIAASPNCDRLTLAVGKELEKAFGGWQKPS